MPEEVEVPTEKLHEAIQEELEHEGGRLLKLAALTTALLAACAAVAALEAGGTINEALLLKADATRLQAEASDQWAYYQAKGVKSAVAEASRTSWLAIGKEPPASYAELQARYAREQEEIKKAAEEKQRERDQKEREADALLHHHHRYADAVALFQVSIALGAVAALTRNRFVWIGSVGIGIAGLALGLVTLLGLA
ncbi:MAG TPA: DUF4337 domain-containing protein [Vicinamibacterales bacterium]